MMLENNEGFDYCPGETETRLSYVRALQQGQRLLIQMLEAVPEASHAQRMGWVDEFNEIHDKALFMLETPKIVEPQ